VSAPGPPFAPGQEKQNKTYSGRTDLASSLQDRKGKAWVDSSAQDKKGGIEMQGNEICGSVLVWKISWEDRHFPLLRIPLIGGIPRSETRERNLLVKRVRQFPKGWLRPMPACPPTSEGHLRSIAPAFAEPASAGEGRSATERRRRTCPIRFSKAGSSDPPNQGTAKASRPQTDESLRHDRAIDLEWPDHTCLFNLYFPILQR